jgi:2-oxo-3-hexenedioate decarboxylase
MTITLSPENISLLADRIEAAQNSAQPIAKLTNDFPAMTVADGYAIQLELRRRWLAEGRRQTGWKAGLTSKAKMEQMGVFVPGIGILMADMARPENSAMRTDDLVHPRVECEIAFVTKHPLKGANCTREEVLAATEFVLPALEIIDSRFADFKFDLPSVIADNSSSARYITGGRARYPDDLDLSSLGVVMEKNGEVVAMASSADVMEHPAEAVALLVKVLDELGEELPPGSFVMSGAITAAIPVQTGDHILARYQELGSISAKFV